MMLKKQLIQYPNPLVGTVTTRSNSQVPAIIPTTQQEVQAVTTVAPAEITDAEDALPPA